LKEAYMAQGEAEEANKVQERLNEAWVNADVPMPTSGGIPFSESAPKMELTER
jgi:hypothetical protein